MTDWNLRYSTSEYVYGTEPNAFLAAVADWIPPGPVLCLAEGEGRNAVHLARRGHAVTAVDLAPNGLFKAEALAFARGVTVATVRADLAEYAIPTAAWAGIVATFMHLPPPVRRRVHAGVVHGLRPGGVFVLEAYTPAQVGLGTGGPRDPALCVTLAELRDELAGLEFEIARECEREVIEGTGHTGHGAVVQVLARRAAASDAPAATGSGGRLATGARALGARHVDVG